MKIIVVGAGTVGSAICEQLVNEGHDVTVIDSNPTSISEVSSAYDVTAVMGNSADISVLRQAGAETADMLIAVTHMDEGNMLCCYAAKKLGTTYTAARVRNPEYTEFMDLMKADMNLSLTINPEYAVAKKISRMLKFANASKVDTFCDGRVEIAEFTVSESSPICNLSLLDLREKFNTKILVCGVKRDDNVYIPSGNFVIKAQDTVCVTASDEELGNFLKITSEALRPIKNILIFGGGRTTYYLAKMLGKSLRGTTIIEKDLSKCEELSRELGINVTHGDGMRQDLLLEEGIENADAFLALSDTDEENAIVSMYAKKIGVKKIVTMIRSLPYVDFFKDVGINSIVSPKSATVDYILRMARGMANAADSEIESLHRMMDGKIEAVEFIIKESIEGLTDIPLMRLNKIKNSLIACIVREENVIIPSGSDVISKGDRVIVLVTGSIKNIKDILDK
ncbi:MAG: Trk system potassium transporter TrkA [Ruminococcaceae bacterium]|nr:Trk system potassium transporter TrkA [Oscillospiraceae bacterium]